MPDQMGAQKVQEIQTPTQGRILAGKCGKTGQEIVCTLENGNSTDGWMMGAV